MRFEDMGSEFTRSIDDCERILGDISVELRLIAEVDSALLGCRFNARIEELRAKLAMAESERRDLAGRLDTWRVGDRTRHAGTSPA